MHANEALIREFYAAFARRDAEAMARCYHDEVLFTDTVFPMLRGEEARDMWRMLVERGKDLEIVLDEASGDADGGTAHWTARYTFSKTGRKVENRIGALFAFRDGKIVRHVDRFPFWRWAAQALGPVGMLAGWFPPLKWKVRKQAAAGLAAFRARELRLTASPSPPVARVNVPGLPPFSLELQSRVDLVVSADLRDKGIWEPFETAVVCAILRPGDIAIDLGANIGYYTVIAAMKTQPGGTVHAFEPDPENFRLLQANVRLNAVAGVRLVQAAVTDRIGEGELFLSPENQGDHRSYRSREERSRIAIRLTTLDAELRDSPAARLMKIDTQGAEVGILRGMAGLLARWRPMPYLIVEFWPHGLREAGESAEALLALLERSPVDLYEIDESARALVPVSVATMQHRAATDLHPDTTLHTNLLACPRGTPPPTL